MYVGVGARRVRELFAAAKARAPSIIFIDEIDAVGSSRTGKDQHYIKMTLNQLLTEMDGFSQNSGVIVMAATNFPESLDKALTRPGRFDRIVSVPAPDVDGRTQILELYLKDVPCAPDVNARVLARGTPGFAGAELANIVNIASLRAARVGHAQITMEDLEHAKDRVMMGAERKSAIISDQTRKITAFHEGGHALVAIHTQGAVPIHKATIMPRGMALGMVMQLPDKDEQFVTREQLYARLDVCMGGRVAEELIFGVNNITNGASSDISQATAIAREMVTRYGMSPNFGTIDLSEDSRHPVSSETRQKVEAEVTEMIEAAKKRAEALLLKHMDELHRVANALLEHESLTGEEVRAVAAGKKLVRPEPTVKSNPTVATGKKIQPQPST
eukprot:TRINITY_DN2310_c0_g1_i3.p1 TRINITY_DN2310_c0_g1~~TRINITY_DN2310_c0_g1_i3.p1  ORF type:complete len:442 (-),score=102.70 TRINITY_DN2310_c0_g1_i3:11-1171(-)